MNFNYQSSSYCEIWKSLSLFLEVNSPNLVSPKVVDIIEFLIFIAESLNLNVFFRVALNGDVGEFGCN